jgi:ABC-type transport system involved in cytochrome c biogenesis permease subunit
MLKILLLFFLPFISLQAHSPFDDTKDLPVAYEGRFRSLESCARLWLYDMYHKQNLKKNDLEAFFTDDTTAMGLLWKIHFFGHQNWDSSPFFWVHYASVKNYLQLDLLADRFNYIQLKTAIDTNHNIEKAANLEKKATDEIAKLLQELQQFSHYEGSSNNALKPFEDLYHLLKTKGISPNEIAYTLENRFPFIQRLQASGSTLKMLPSKYTQGEWVSLHTFKAKIYDQKTNQLVLSNNFTSFSNEHFKALREAYFELENIILSQAKSHLIALAAKNFANQYHLAYESLAGRRYLQASGKALNYPTQFKLFTETLYYRLPLIEITLIAYALTFILLIVNRKQSRPGFFTLFILGLGFVVHTIVLILRCYILGRPPVSNMFETVVYVPWVAVAIGCIFYVVSRSRIILTAAVMSSFVLLVLLKLTQVDSRLENVQAVLDSQYWLIIHVLMVVGSYGAFAVCGILGHFYLVNNALSNRSVDLLTKIAKGILHTMYAGVALLIPGTILGGVWAAESWGRFWDWDPKESWAFISACVYLLFVHAYTFNYIRDFGLAIGSVAGLMAISFTWYGVNYVLGTGLHSYGFGSGGEWWYFLYIASECLLIAWSIQRHKIHKATQGVKV